MAKPWQTLDRVETAHGTLELRRRGSGDFLITLAGRILMNSRASRSEEALAERACEALTHHPAPRVTIGGLGMGCTLRAALDRLPAEARISVCELNAPVAAWCRGPLAEVSGDALADPRVSLIEGDVAAYVLDLASEPADRRADAILLDLFEGPHSQTDPRTDSFYGIRALTNTRQALTPHGVFAIWSERPDPAFEQRLARTGFAEVTLHRPGKGGRRHAVYVARAPDPRAGGRP